jgi:hypothetical protein
MCSAPREGRFEGKVCEAPSYDDDEGGIGPDLSAGEL